MSDLEQLWVTKIEHSKPRGTHSRRVLDRPATDDEVKAYAANLDGALIDYEALIGEVGLRLLRRVNRGETLTPERVITEMLNVFDAALPDEETPDG